MKLLCIPTGVANGIFDRSPHFPIACRRATTVMTMGKCQNVMEKLVRHINWKDWWHVPPRPSCIMRVWQVSGRVPLQSRVSLQFVVDRDCAKAGLLLPIGGRDADWFAIGQC